jgi:MFS transporter, DHA2 family, multidrug resistance protein
MTAVDTGRDPRRAVRRGIMTIEHPGQAPTDDGRYKWKVLVAVVFGAFASILDSTIVNTALPQIQMDFKANLHLASYVATAYILAAGVVVPASAYLANRFGIKRVYLLSLTVFTVGSVLCGLAPTMIVLILFRVLQGAGGAGLFSLSFALLFAAFPQNERGKANGVFGIPVLVAPTIGPTLGGFLTQYVDWRWIFFVNLPVGILGVVLGTRVLRRSPARPEVHLDRWGLLLAALGLGALLFGLSNLAYDGLGSLKTVTGPIILGAVVLVVFIPVELRKRQPLLDLRLYGRRNFAIGNAITILAVIGLFGPAFLLPQFLQNLRGLTPFAAGLLLLWQGIGSLAGTVLSGQTYNRIGPRRLILIGGLGAAATSFVLAGWITPTSDLSVLPWVLIARGVMLPLLMQSTGTTTLDGITGPALPGATTLNVVLRNVVASLAIAVLTNILQQRSQGYLARLGRTVPPIPVGAHLAGRVPAAVLNAQALAFHDVFLITAAATVPAVFLVYFLRPLSGRQASRPPS